MRTVLFVCTGNSCRSQMAEAIVNARMPGWRAASAGTHPAGAVHPLAQQVLREIGIPHEGHPKGVEQFLDQSFDVIVTVCDDASEECPVWVGSGRRLHRSFRDPARVEGTDEQRLAGFRQVRDEMLAAIPPLLAGQFSDTPATDA